MSGLLKINIRNKSFSYPTLPDGHSSSEAAIKRIRIGTFSKAIDYAPFYVARHFKWFEKIGIEVIYKEYPTLQSINKAIDQNQLDLVFEAEAPAIESQKLGIPIRVIGTTSLLTLEIISHIHSSIKNLKDAKNRKIGTLKGTSSHYGVLSSLEQNGIHAADIKIVDLKPEKAKVKFENRQIDAWAVWPPFPEEQLITGKAKILEGEQTHISSIIAAREDLVIGNQKVIDNILKVIVRAKKWIQDNEISAQKIISEELNIRLDVVQLAWPKLDFKIDIKTNVVLSDLTFNINKGEFVTILGPSGSGKSTLLKIISGLDTDYQGSAILQEKKINGVSSECGIMFQEHRLLPWLNVKDNVSLGLKKESTNAVNHLLKTLGIENFAKSYPYQLSGGMAQRVSLGRALVNAPTLMLLDEPFSFLDIRIKQSLHDKLLEIARKENVTILMVSHDIEEAVYLSDRILVMTPRPGSIIRSYEIDLPYPRKRTNPQFSNLVSTITQDLQKELKLI